MSFWFRQHSAIEPVMKDALKYLQVLRVADGFYVVCIGAMSVAKAYVARIARGT